MSPPPFLREGISITPEGKNRGAVQHIGYYPRREGTGVTVLLQGVLPHPIPLNLTYVIALKLAKSTLPPLSLNIKLEM